MKTTKEKNLYKLVSLNTFSAFTNLSCQLKINFSNFSFLLKILSHMLGMYFKEYMVGKNHLLFIHLFLLSNTNNMLLVFLF